MQVSQSSYKPKSLSPLGMVDRATGVPVSSVLSSAKSAGKAAKTVSRFGANAVGGAVKSLKNSLKPYSTPPKRTTALDQTKTDKDGNYVARSAEEILEEMKEERKAKRGSVQQKISQMKSFMQSRGKIFDFYKPDSSKAKTLPNKEDAGIDAYNTIDDINNDFGLVQHSDQVLDNKTQPVVTPKALEHEEQMKTPTGGLTAKDAIGDVAKSVDLGGFSLGGVSDELSSIVNTVGADKTASRAAMAEQVLGKALANADTAEVANGRALPNIAKPAIDADAVDFGVVV